MNASRSPSTPAAPGAATTSTFFSHCFGRASRTYAATPGLTARGSGSVGCGTAEGDMSDLERLVFDDFDEIFERGRDMPHPYQEEHPDKQRRHNAAREEADLVTQEQ